MNICYFCQNSLLDNLNCKKCPLEVYHVYDSTKTLTDLYIFLDKYETISFHFDFEYNTFTVFQDCYEKCLIFFNYIPNNITPANAQFYLEKFLKLKGFI